MGRSSEARRAQESPVVKRKKTGVRSPRKTSARPTRDKPSPKLREGGRQSSPFKSEWKYLDLSEESDRSPRSGGSSRGGGSPGSSLKGRDRADRSQRSLPSRSDAESFGTGSPVPLTYYEPPPKVKPFRDLTDEQVLQWFDKQDEQYQSHTVANIVEWDAHWTAKGKPIGLTIRPAIVKYLRLQTAPPCSCGFSGNPRETHTLDARKCFQRKPPELEDDDDDDLPF